MWIHWDRELGVVYLHQAQVLASSFWRSSGQCCQIPRHPLPDNFILFYPWETLSPDGDLDPPEGVRVEEPLSLEDRRLYQQIVGSLNYAAHVTRLDIAHAVSQLSRASQKPRPRHLDAARVVCSTLPSTGDWCISYSKESGGFLEAWCDAWVGAHGQLQQHDRYASPRCGGPVTWCAKKQDRKTTSTTDSESLAVMTTTQHIQHMRDLLVEFGHMQRWPTPLYNDNSACISRVLSRAHITGVCSLPGLWASFVSRRMTVSSPLSG